MTVANTAAGTGAAQARWPRVVLLIVAFLYLYGGLQTLPILFGNLAEVPGPGVGGAIILGCIILQPILALAALIFAVRHKLYYALLAVALLILCGWMSYLPSIAIHGLGIDGASNAYMLGLTFVNIILPPFLVLAVAALALMERHLKLATILAILPMIFHTISVLAFGVSVAIYGF